VAFFVPRTYVASFLLLTKPEVFCKLEGYRKTPFSLYTSKLAIMKKLFFVLSVLTVFSFKESGLSKDEKTYATRFLKDTEKEVFDAVKGLSEAQLKFKPAPDKWSVEEIVKHIAISEKNLWAMVDGTLKEPANPEMRSNIKATDQQVIDMIESCAQKVKTFETFEPKNTPYTSLDDALNAFKESRNQLIKTIKKTGEDYRNHVTKMPMGSFDAYQMVLFISAHTNRHVQQINEVKADANFPAI
jgi:hypothetical protein